MKMYLKFALIIGLIWMCNCKGDTIGSPESPVKTATIEGNVLDETTYQHLSNVVITTDPETEEALSSSFGEYIIADIQPKIYTITATKAGYQPQTVTADVDSGGTLIANFRLVPDGWGVTIPDNLPPIVITTEHRWDENVRNRVTILCTTNEITQGIVEYGIPPNFDHTVNDYAFKRIHTFVLDNLQPNTTYYYRVILNDQAGNEKRVEGLTFTTLPGN